MALLTERVQFTVPCEVKAEWTALAAARGISLGAYLRDVVEQLLAEHELGVAIVELDARNRGISLQ